MKRIDTPTAEPNLHGTGKAGFRDGHGFPDVEATEINASMLNHLQEEIARPIEGMGYSLNPGSYTQLFTAIRAAIRTFPVIGSLALRANENSHEVDALDAVCFVPRGGPLGLGLFVAVGVSGVNVDLTFDAATWTSYDGLNWTKTNVANLGRLYGVAASADTVVAVGKTANARPRVVRASLDGSFAPVDISALALADHANPVHDVCWDSVASRFIAVGDRSTPGVMLMYSNSDGSAWTLATPGSSYLGEFHRVISLGSRTIAFGTQGEIQTSDDGGETWTRRHTDPTLGTIRSARAGSNAILASTERARTLLRSVNNGTSWTEITTPDLSAIGIVDAAIEHVGRFDRILFAVCKDSLSGRRAIIGTMDGGLTWPYAVRMPAVDTSGEDAATITASADDSCRLVLVGKIVDGGNDAVKALAFASSSGAVAEIA